MTFVSVHDFSRRVAHSGEAELILIMNQDRRGTGKYVEGMGIGDCEVVRCRFFGMCPCIGKCDPISYLVLEPVSFIEFCGVNPLSSGLICRLDVTFSCPESMARGAGDFGVGFAVAVSVDSDGGEVAELLRSGHRVGDDRGNDFTGDYISSEDSLAGPSRRTSPSDTRSIFPV